MTLPLSRAGSLAASTAATATATATSPATGPSVLPPAALPALPPRGRLAAAPGRAPAPPAPATAAAALAAPAATAAAPAVAALVQVFERPLVGPDGRTYEHAALARAADGDGLVRLPGVAQPVRLAALVPNYAVQALGEALRARPGGDPEAAEAAACCPISGAPFEDPVLTADGHTYERREIARWLGGGHATSPLSRQVLGGPGDVVILVANQALRAMLAQLAGQAAPPPAPAPSTVALAAAAAAPQTSGTPETPETPEAHRRGPGAAWAAAGPAAPSLLGSLMAGLAHAANVATCIGIAAAAGGGGCAAGVACGAAVAGGAYVVTARLALLEHWAPAAAAPPAPQQMGRAPVPPAA